jgi:3-methyl-2-oxobutanoate hydroxymethyltransferase
MVMHGHESTLTATTELMAIHTAAVARGLKNKFLIADMPFLSFRKSRASTLESVERLMHAGAHGVKIEGTNGHLSWIRDVVESGVPVMGHLGLTPQSIHQLGGFKVQGREERAREAIFKQARQLQEVGCFSLVLECVPSSLATAISKELSIPTIGIGAGPDTDGQVLVFQDLLGLNRSFKPKFLRRFVDGYGTLHEGLQSFVQQVQSGAFPNHDESYFT